MSEKQFKYTLSECEGMQGAVMLLPTEVSKNFECLMTSEQLAEICPEAMHYIFNDADRQGYIAPQYITVKFMEAKDLPLGVMSYIRAPMPAKDTQ